MSLARRPSFSLSGSRLLLLLLAALALGGCAVGDSSACSPACGEGLICCDEPSHLPSPDGGVGTAARCVAPSEGLCPKQP